MLKSTAFAAAFAAAAVPAAAQEEPAEAPLGAGDGAIDLYGELSLLSDYRFRGVSRSDEDPAGQTALTLSHRGGVYAGARATSLAGIDPWRGRDLGDAEIDFYAGYGAPLGNGFELDAGAVYYVFAGGGGATDYVEPYASLSYLIGPVEATAGAKYAPSQRAIGGDDMLYLFGQIDVGVPFRPWAFSAQLGRQRAGAFADYWSWSLGVEHRLRIAPLPEAQVALRYVDTDLAATPGADAGLVLSVGLEF